MSAAHSARTSPQRQRPGRSRVSSRGFGVIRDPDAESHRAEMADFASPTFLRPPAARADSAEEDGYVVQIVPGISARVDFSSVGQGPGRGRSASAGRGASSPGRAVRSKGESFLRDHHAMALAPERASDPVFGRHPSRGRRADEPASPGVDVPVQRGKTPWRPAGRSSLYPHGVEIFRLGNPRAPSTVLRPSDYNPRDAGPGARQQYDYPPELLQKLVRAAGRSRRATPTREKPARGGVGDTRPGSPFGAQRSWAQSVQGLDPAEVPGSPAPSSLATPPWATPPESLAVDRFGATGRSSRPSRRSETSRHASPLGTSNSFYLGVSGFEKSFKRSTSRDGTPVERRTSASATHSMTFAERFQRMSGMLRAYEPPPDAAGKPAFRAGPAAMTEERRRLLSLRSSANALNRLEFASTSAAGQTALSEAPRGARDGSPLSGSVAGLSAPARGLTRTLSPSSASEWGLYTDWGGMSIASTRAPPPEPLLHPKNEVLVVDSPQTGRRDRFWSPSRRSLAGAAAPADAPSALRASTASLHDRRMTWDRTSMSATSQRSLGSSRVFEEGVSDSMHLTGASRPSSARGDGPSSARGDRPGAQGGAAGTSRDRPGPAAGSVAREASSGALEGLPLAIPSSVEEEPLAEGAEAMQAIHEQEARVRREMERLRALLSVSGAKPGAEGPAGGERDVAGAAASGEAGTGVGMGHGRDAGGAEGRPRRHLRRASSSLVQRSFAMGLSDDEDRSSVEEGVEGSGAGHVAGNAAGGAEAGEGRPGSVPAAGWGVRGDSNADSAAEVLRPSLRLAAGLWSEDGTPEGSVAPLSRAGDSRDLGLDAAQVTQGAGGGQGTTTRTADGAGAPREVASASRAPLAGPHASPPAPAPGSPPAAHAAPGGSPASMSPPAPATTTQERLAAMDAQMAALTRELMRTGTSTSSNASGRGGSAAAGSARTPGAGAGDGEWDGAGAGSRQAGQGAMAGPASVASGEGSGSEGPMMGAGSQGAGRVLTSTFSMSSSRQASVGREVSRGSSAKDGAGLGVAHHGAAGNSFLSPIASMEADPPMEAGAAAMVAQSAWAPAGSNSKAREGPRHGGNAFLTEEEDGDEDPAPIADSTSRHVLRGSGEWGSAAGAEAARAEGGRAGERMTAAAGSNPFEGSSEASSRERSGRWASAEGAALGVVNASVDVSLSMDPDAKAGSERASEGGALEELNRTSEPGSAMGEGPAEYGGLLSSSPEDDLRPGGGGRGLGLRYQQDWGARGGGGGGGGAGGGGAAQGLRYQSWGAGEGSSAQGQGFQEGPTRSASAERGGADAPGGAGAAGAPHAAESACRASELAPLSPGWASDGESLPGAAHRGDLGDQVTATVGGYEDDGADFDLDDAQLRAGGGVSGARGGGSHTGDVGGGAWGAPATPAHTVDHDDYEVSDLSSPAALGTAGGRAPATAPGERVRWGVQEGGQSPVDATQSEVEAGPGVGDAAPSRAELCGQTPTRLFAGREGTGGADDSAARADEGVRAGSVSEAQSGRGGEGRNADEAGGEGSVPVLARVLRRASHRTESIVSEISIRAGEGIYERGAGVQRSRPQAPGKRAAGPAYPADRASGRAAGAAGAARRPGSPGRVPWDSTKRVVPPPFTPYTLAAPMQAPMPGAAKGAQLTAHAPPAASARPTSAGPKSRPSPSLGGAAAKAPARDGSRGRGDDRAATRPGSAGRPGTATGPSQRPSSADRRRGSGSAVKARDGAVRGATEVHPSRPTEESAGLARQQRRGSTSQPVATGKGGGSDSVATEARTGRTEESAWLVEAWVDESVGRRPSEAAPGDEVAKPGDDGGKASTGRADAELSWKLGRAKEALAAAGEAALRLRSRRGSHASSLAEVSGPVDAPMQVASQHAPQAQTSTDLATATGRAGQPPAGPVHGAGGPRAAVASAVGDGEATGATGVTRQHAPVASGALGDLQQPSQPRPEEPTSPGVDVLPSYMTSPIRRAVAPHRPGKDDAAGAAGYVPAASPNTLGRRTQSLIADKYTRMLVMEALGLSGTGADGSGAGAGSVLAAIENQPGLKRAASADKPKGSPRGPVDGGARAIAGRKREGTPSKSPVTRKRLSVGPPPSPRRDGSDASPLPGPLRRYTTWLESSLSPEALRAPELGPEFDPAMGTATGPETGATDGDATPGRGGPAAALATSDAQVRASPSGRRGAGAAPPDGRPMTMGRWESGSVWGTPEGSRSEALSEAAWPSADAPAMLRGRPGESVRGAGRLGQRGSPAAPSHAVATGRDVALTEAPAGAVPVVQSGEGPGVGLERFLSVESAAPVWRGASLPPATEGLAATEAETGHSGRHGERDSKGAQVAAPSTHVSASGGPPTTHDASASNGGAGGADDVGEMPGSSHSHGDVPGASLRMAPSSPARTPLPSSAVRVSTPTPDSAGNASFFSAGTDPAREARLAGGVAGRDASATRARAATEFHECVSVQGGPVHASAHEAREVAARGLPRVSSAGGMGGAEAMPSTTGRLRAASAAAGEPPGARSAWRGSHDGEGDTSDWHGTGDASVEAIAGDVEPGVGITAVEVAGTFGAWNARDAGDALAAGESGRVPERWAAETGQAPGSEGGAGEVPGGGGATTAASPTAREVRSTATEDGRDDQEADPAPALVPAFEESSSVSPKDAALTAPSTADLDFAARPLGAKRGAPESPGLLSPREGSRRKEEEMEFEATLSPGRLSFDAAGTDGGAQDGASGSGAEGEQDADSRDAGAARATEDEGEGREDAAEAATGVGPFAGDGPSVADPAAPVGSVLHGMQHAAFPEAPGTPRSPRSPSAADPSALASPPVSPDSPPGPIATAAVTTTPPPQPPALARVLSTPPRSAEPGSPSSTSTRSPMPLLDAFDGGLFFAEGSEAEVGRGGRGRGKTRGRVLGDFGSLDKVTSRLRVAWGTDDALGEGGAMDALDTAEAAEWVPPVGEAGSGHEAGGLDEGPSARKAQEGLPPVVPGDVGGAASDGDGNGVVSSHGVASSDGDESGSGSEWGDERVASGVARARMLEEAAVAALVWLREGTQRRANSLPSPTVLQAVLRGEVDVSLGGNAPLLPRQHSEDGEGTHARGRGDTAAPSDGAGVAGSPGARGAVESLSGPTRSVFRLAAAQSTAAEASGSDPPPLPSPPARESRFSPGRWAAEPAPASVAALARQLEAGEWPSPAPIARAPADAATPSGRVRELTEQLQFQLRSRNLDDPSSNYESAPGAPTTGIKPTAARRLPPGAVATPFAAQRLSQGTLDSPGPTPKARPATANSATSPLAGLSDTFEAGLVSSPSFAFVEGQSATDAGSPKTRDASVTAGTGVGLSHALTGASRVPAGAPASAPSRTAAAASTTTDAEASAPATLGPGTEPAAPGERPAPAKAPPAPPLPAALRQSAPKPRAPSAAPPVPAALLRKGSAPVRSASLGPIVVPTGPAPVSPSSTQASKKPAQAPPLPASLAKKPRVGPAPPLPPSLAPKTKPPPAPGPAPAAPPPPSLAKGKAAAPPAPGGKAPPAPPPPVPPLLGKKLAPPPPLPPKAPAKAAPAAKEGAASEEGPASASRLKLRLKPLHWEKLVARAGTVWERLLSQEEAAGVDWAELERLFAIQYSEAAQRLADAQRAGRPARGGTIHIVGARRAHLLGIELSGVRLALAEVCAAVLSFDAQALSGGQLEVLARAVPTADERAELEAYARGEHPRHPGLSDPGMLAAVDRYFLQILPLPRLEGRLKALEVCMGGGVRAQQLGAALASVVEACEALRASAAFQRTLRSVLQVGNFMNDGTARGGAAGFRLAFLLSLADVRASTDKDTSVLHFLVEQSEAEGGDGGMVALPRELSAVTRAAAVDLPAVGQALGELAGALRRADAEVAAAERLRAEEEAAPLSTVDAALCSATGLDPLTVAASHAAFLGRTRGDLSALAATLAGVRAMEDRARASLEALSAFFGEAHSAAQPTAVLRTVAGFLRDVDRAMADVRQRRKEEAERAARALRGAVSASGVPSGMQTPRAAVVDDAAGGPGLDPATPDAAVLAAKLAGVVEEQGAEDHRRAGSAVWSARSGQGTPMQSTTPSRAPATPQTSRRSLMADLTLLSGEGQTSPGGGDAGQRRT